MQFIVQSFSALLSKSVKHFQMMKNVRLISKNFEQKSLTARHMPNELNLIRLTA